MPTLIARAAKLLFYTCIFPLLLPSTLAEHPVVQPGNTAHRIAGGDMPLNLVEVEDRWLISTNSGWHNAYLQIYDEQAHKVSARMDVPSAWYGLAYDGKRKLL